MAVNMSFGVPMHEGVRGNRYSYKGVKVKEREVMEEDKVGIKERALVGLVRRFVYENRGKLKVYRGNVEASGRFTKKILRGRAKGNVREFVGEGFERVEVDEKGYIEILLRVLGRFKEEYELKSPYWFMFEENGKKKIVGRNFLDVVSMYANGKRDVERVYIVERCPVVGFMNVEEVKSYEKLKRYFKEEEKADEKVSSYLGL